ncbi:hypothetical protein AAHE18_03G185900 [Arachis hypogaea]
MANTEGCIDSVPYDCIYDDGSLDIGNSGHPRQTYVSKMLSDDFKKEMVEILKEYCDCFAWDYEEIPGLSYELVEHQLPLKANVKPIKQPPKRFAPEVVQKIKEEIERLLKAKFIRTTRYNGKLRVCIDFRDLNSATPKDKYPIPIADMLIDSIGGHEILSFMDGYSGYYQIYIAEEDVSKTAFRFPEHLENLKKAFERMRKHKLKMSPLKCAFGVSVGNFLGFLVQKKGIEIDKNKAKAILMAPPPANKKQLQAFLGKVNYCRRFISNLSEKTKHQEALDNIKQYLTNPPIMTPPWDGAPLKLYVSASEATIGGMLAQEDENSNERVIYYLSRVLNDVESSLYFSYLKLKYYLIPKNVYVISNFDILKYMLSSSILHAVKGQVLADFLVDHPCMDIDEKLLGFVGLSGVGIGILIISPSSEPSKFLFELNYSCSNNEAEYEALIMGLELLFEKGVKNVKIFGDSQLVVRQVSLEYRCVSKNLRKYFNVAIKLLSGFDNVILRHVPRELNQETNELAQISSRYKIKPSTLEKFVRIKDIFMPLREREVLSLEKLDPEDWRVPIMEYLENPSLSVDRKFKYRAQSYVLINNVLFKKSVDGNLLTCLGEKEAYLALAEVHEGICDAHQRRLYWPTIQRDCINYARSCEECQKHGSLQHISASELHVIVKPWPFRGWTLDLIGQIHPPSSKGHKFILHIVHRFGIPQSITTDQGTMFIGIKVMEYAKSTDIKMLSSTSYYVQANGQVEATNKILIALIKKHIGRQPRNWHQTLSQVLWTYRNSPRGSTGTTPYKLVYGHDAVLPIDINLQSIRVARQDEIPVVDYWNSLYDELNELDDERLRTLERVIRQKEIMSKSYNRC